MSTELKKPIEVRPGESLQGLRMTADEFFALPEIEDARYELIDGVVIQHWYSDPDQMRPERARDVYHGLRMTADEFFALGETRDRYELVDGVVLMSPSATPRHQKIAAEIEGQLLLYLRTHPGSVFHETDVHFGQGPATRDLVYRPDLIFICGERWRTMGEKITGAPDVVVEVLSPESRNIDTETKKADYERFGVREYWIVDPDAESLTFYQLRDGRYVEARPERDTYRSEAIPAFILDLARVREAIRAW